MGYSRDLLDAAWTMHMSPSRNQALLRRAISTAYYALFHLLIEDACANWPRPDQRKRLARQFDHKRMKEASAMMARRSPAGSDLFVVSSTFVHLQENRHDADYDLTVTFSDTDVTLDLIATGSAFQSWERVRQQDTAQDYLFSLLFRDRFQGRVRGKLYETCSRRSSRRMTISCSPSRV